MEQGDRHGRIAEHEVWMTDEPPSYEHLLPHLTIYDSRHTELLTEIRKQNGDVARPGFKKLPTQLVFGLRG